MSNIHSPTQLTASPARFRAGKVLALCGDTMCAARVEDALRRLDGVELNVLSATAPDLLGQFITYNEPDLILVDADLSDAGMGPSVERALQTHLSGRPLVVRSGELKPDAVRRLMRLGAAELIDANAPPEELANAVQRQMALRAMPQSARVTAFFSPRGGVGVSTLAVETAVAIAQRLPANSNGACLVDLNFQFGVDASLLNVQPAFNPAVALDPNRIDAQMLDAFLSAHKSRLQVLAAPPEWRQPNNHADGVARLLDIAAERFAHVVIDLPREFTSITEAVLSSADQLFVVTDLSVPGLQLARGALAALDSRLQSGSTLSVIINRVSRRDRSVSLTMRDVHRVLPCKRIFVVHEDDEAAAESMDRGEPLLSASPDSRLAREITEAIRQSFPVEFGGEAQRRRNPTSFLNIAKYR